MRSPPPDGGYLGFNTTEGQNALSTQLLCPQSGTTAPVIVSDGGQLGTVASSERFKKDIASMEKASEAILLLRPVTFHYNGWVATVDREGRTIWIADLHRDDGKRFIVRADEKLTVFVEFESAVRAR